MMSIAHFVVGIIGNVIALFLFLAPIATFKRILENKSTEQFSGIPYVMTLLNNLLSAWYGLPFVSPNNVLVMSINGVGAVIESGYILVFLVLAPKKDKLKIAVLLTLVLTIFTAVAMVSVFAIHGNVRKTSCGIAACLSSIIMYGSPLSVMWLVIKTKSVEYMPFLLSLSCFLCATSWFIYGLLGRDPFVAVPNAIGCAFGAMQLIIYFIYYDKEPGNNKKTTAEHTAEMGLNGTDTADQIA